MKIKFRFTDDYIKLFDYEKIPKEQTFKEKHIIIENGYVKAWAFNKTAHPEVMWRLDDMEYLEVENDN